MRYHLSASIRGMLKWTPQEFEDATEWITADGWSKLTADQIRDSLLDELAKGRELLPHQKCDNFDYLHGCLGHEDTL